MQQDVRELLKQLMDIDRRAAVWSACQCARTVLHFIPTDEDRPRKAIETAEAWVSGQASVRDCRTADIARKVGFNGTYSAAYAAYAATASTYAATAATYAATAATYAADTAATAAYVYDPEDDAALEKSRKRHLDQLHHLVCSLPWPRTTPTTAQLHAATPPIQVAWNAVSGTSDELTMAQLVAAHDHATALGLDWVDPVQRAIAERMQDVAQVNGLLQGAAIDAAGG